MNTQTIDSKTRLQQEIIRLLPAKPSGRLLLAPRFGKTKLMIDIIKREKPDSVLWVSPSAQLCQIDIPTEFVKWDATEFLPALKFFTYTSFPTYTRHYKMVVLDEEQCLTERNAANLLNKTLTCEYMLSMTGTATEHGEKHGIYSKLGLKVLYELDINEAVGHGILSNYQINLVRVAMSDKRDLLIKKPGKSWWTSEKKNYEYLSDSIRRASVLGSQSKDVMFRIFARMRFIGNAPSKLRAVKYMLGQQIKGKTLIFAANIKQAKELCEHTYHSKTDDKSLRLFQENKIERIAMVNSGGIGYTYKGIDNLVVVQADSDRNGTVSQKIARTLLVQSEYKANIWIFCLQETQDEKWVNLTLERFDKSKVREFSFSLK